MNKTKEIAKKYTSRILLLLLLVCFLGCDDVDCNSQAGPCEKKDTVSEKGQLTSDNPSMVVKGGKATKCCGASVRVCYNWTGADLDVTPSETDKPQISVKFGTVEGGVLKDTGTQSLITRPAKMWATIIDYEGEGIEKGSVYDIVHFTVKVTLKQPLIKLPKGPTISLPFIGPLIGPKPRPVDVSVDITYYPSIVEKD
jgi:hypothetical protein